MLVHTLSHIPTSLTVPEVKEQPLFNTNQATGVIDLDWTSVFRSNGPVRRYTLTRNGIPLFSRPLTTVTLSNEPRGTGMHVCVFCNLTCTSSNTPITCTPRSIRMYSLHVYSSLLPSLSHPRSYVRCDDSDQYW